jgi:protein-S-isoprenylcysteine O-methyltransferase Ste14
MHHKASGRSLVYLQFLTLAAQLFLAGGALLDGPPPAGAVALALAAIALGLWALRANRPGNFNIHPSPRDGGRLIEAGPYRFIRHPMYTALMLFGGACGWITDSFPGWMLELTLVCVLAIKALLEEWMLARAHPAYADYRARTRAFVPFVF